MEDRIAFSFNVDCAGEVDFGRDMPSQLQSPKSVPAPFESVYRETYPDTMTVIPAIERRDRRMMADLLGNQLRLPSIITPLPNKDFT